MGILDDVLEYRLLNSAYLSIEQKQLVNVIFRKMEYDIMKDQLRNVFINNAGDLLLITTI